jgi:hypothetical protein
VNILKSLPVKFTPDLLLLWRNFWKGEWVQHGRFVLFQHILSAFGWQYVASPAEGHTNILHVCFCWHCREHLIFTKSLSTEAPPILSTAQTSAEMYFRLAAITSVLD